MRIAIYAPYVIINKCGLDLAFKTQSLVLASRHITCTPPFLVAHFSIEHGSETSVSSTNNVFLFVLRVAAQSSSNQVSRYRMESRLFFYGYAC
jgi:hypothetical protein